MNLEPLTVNCLGEKTEERVPFSSSSLLEELVTKGNEGMNAGVGPLKVSHK